MRGWRVVPPRVAREGASAPVVQAAAPAQGHRPSPDWNFIHYEADCKRPDCDFHRFNKEATA